MAKKLNSMRLLDREGITYEVLHFPDTIHSALGVAAHLGIPASQVYKTLVLITAKKTPILVIVPADQQIEIKHLGKLLGDKKLRMATQNEAEALTGLKVGGISALALHQRHFPTYIDHSAAGFDTILVSAGQRGIDLRLRVADVVRITGATWVETAVSAIS
jgi:Cys-tRNA(Pro)/Cys-tRNA(Cys) deacylase